MLLDRAAYRPATRPLVSLLTLTALLPAALAGQVEAPGATAYRIEARTLGGLPTQAATLLVQGGRGGQLALAPLAVPMAGRVPLLVELEGTSLLSDREGETLRLELYAYALTPDGRVAGFLTQGFRLDLSEWGEALFDSGVKFVGHLELDPGEYSLRILVMDPDDGRYGLRTLPVDVPGPQAPARLLSPLFTEPAGAWILVREARKPVEPPAGEPASDEASEVSATPSPTAREDPLSAAVRPLLLGDRSLLPAAWPVLPTGQPVGMELLGIGLEGTPPIVGHLTPEGGSEGASVAVDVELLARLETGLPSLARWSTRLTLPEVETGGYVLHLSTEDGTAVAPPFRVLALAGDLGEEHLVWGQIRSRLASPEQVAEIRQDLPSRRKKRNRALERAAREGLETHLRRIAESGLSAETLDALAEFERTFEEQVPGEAVPALTRAKEEIISRLGDADPQALVPLMSLHLDLYLRYRLEDRYALATHSREMVAELADQCVRRTRGEAPRVLASRALTLLGGKLLEVRVWTQGERFLEQALDYDEANETALLLLAAQRERHGEYGLAVDTLRRLVDLNPKSAEGRLRLALNLRRSGHPPAAERLLHRLISEANPAWTLTVAYNELARTLLDEGRLQDAVVVLREGLDRLPEQGSLHIQLAYALDRQRRFREARQVLADMERHTLDDGASPRRRYAAWPEQGLDEARELLDRAAASRLPRLSSALELTPEEAANRRKIREQRQKQSEDR